MRGGHGYQGWSMGAGLLHWGLGGGIAEWDLGMVFSLGFIGR